MDDETSKPDLPRVLPIVEERASQFSKESCRFVEKEKSLGGPLFLVGLALLVSPCSCSPTREHTGKCS